MVNTTCKLLGVGFVLTGIVGFFAPHLLGMHLSAFHNIVHLISGTLALAFGLGSAKSARVFAMTFGSVYLGLGVLGFAFPDAVGSLLHASVVAQSPDLGPDNIVHVALGTVFLVAALLPQRIDMGRHRLPSHPMI